MKNWFDWLYEKAEPVYVRSQLFWFAIWAATTGVGWYLSPSRHGHGTHQQLGLPPCYSVVIFDRPCPGCGLTTSWTAFIHGQFGVAFKAHPLGIPLYLLFTFIGVGSLYGNIRNVRLRMDSNWFQRLFVGSIAVFFIFGLVRMAMMPKYSATQKELLWRQVIRK